MPHTRLDASPQFKGKSKRGLYGDVIEEIDFNVGRMLDAVTEMGLADNTYVIFTSDNGPWLIKNKDFMPTDICPAITVDRRGRCAAAKYRRLKAACEFRALSGGRVEFPREQRATRSPVRWTFCRRWLHWPALKFPQIVSSTARIFGICSTVSSTRPTADKAYLLLSACPSASRSPGQVEVAPATRQGTDWRGTVQ